MTLCGSPLLRSLLGVKRTSLFAAQMSAFDPKRTLVESLASPSRASLRNVQASFDEAVGAKQNRGRDREVQGLRCLEIDNQLEPSWLLDGKISRLRTFEDEV
jgi:hypothetical protein